MELSDSPQRLEAFRHGDREVLATLYEEHVDAVERFLRAGFTFTSRGATVRFRGFDEPFRLQEAIQEGFIHAFRQKSREAYDGAQQYRPYLLTIIRNHVIDGFRREQTERKYFVPLEQAAPDARSEHDAMERLAGQQEQRTSPEVAAFQKQLQGVLATFIDGLDPEDRQVIEEHMLGEATQTTMADRLGESRNDVRKRIRQIRAALLRHLKSEGLIETLDAGAVFSNLSVVMIALVSPRMVHL